MAAEDDRSSVTGQFVSAEEAAANPESSVHETRSPGLRVHLDEESVEAIAQRVVEKMTGQLG